MKTIVITGATGGIGAATARAFAAEGYTVIAAYRSKPAEAEALVASLPGAGHVALPATVEESATLATLAAEVETRFGR